MTDALSTLLDDVRPRGALFERSAPAGEWSLRFGGSRPLALAAMLHGEGWITAEGQAPIALGTGDVAVVVGSAPYTISSAPGVAPTVLVGEGNRCTTADGRQLEELTAGCADGAPGSDVLLTGTYQVRGSVCDRILQGLPPVLVVRADELPYPVVGIVAAELGRPRPGRQAVLDRLLDLLLVTTLREWLDRPGSGAPAWYHAQHDPVVGTALRLMHDDPAHAWSVAELARRSAVSRSAFARRFTELVGEPPMSYLACWRLWLAADQLAQTDDTVDAIARRVGCANAYALSVAFKRVYGIRPGEHRIAAGSRRDAERASA
ncbi:AraC family transcriptional regulator [Pseudonocardia nigra]|uniref:AraC family transcriptional regulator n=1 Tax=Pseudonocardia nigra TaxID=1921578 RepID=UPI0027E2CCBA|nr:AraC family transcriptional regulator [Pseudonocardia nigra]